MKVKEFLATSSDEDFLVGIYNEDADDLGCFWLSGWRKGNTFSRSFDDKEIKSWTTLDTNSLLDIVIKNE